MKKTTIKFLTGILIITLASCQSIKKAEQNKHQVLTQEQKYKQADLFARAVTLKETGKYKQADSLFKAALSIDPEDAATNYQEGYLLSLMGNSKEGLDYAKKAIEKDSANIWYQVLFANLSRANGDYKAYVSAYKKIVKARPSSERFVEELANAYNYVGDYKNALKAYINLEDLIGMRETLSQKIAALYLRLGEKEKALNEYEKLVKTNPDNQRSYALLAEFAAKNGFPEKAEWAYQKIIEINPNDPYIHISLADFYRKQGKTDLAFEELKKGFGNPELDVTTEINLLAAYYSGNLTQEQTRQALVLAEIIKKAHPDEPVSKAFYASMLFQNKKYKEALPLLQKAIEENTDNYALREQILFTYLNLEDYKMLEKEANKTIKTFSIQPIPYMMAGIAAFQLKKYQLALTYLNKGKDFATGNNALLEQFFSTLGDTYHELKMNQKAYENYEQALSLNPDNAIVLNNFAYYLAQDRQQLDRAEKMALKAVKADPYNENNLDTYAWVLYQQKKYDEALDWAKKALDNGGEKSAVVLEHYGDILYRLNRKKEALIYWKKARKKEGYSKFLDQKIKTGKLYE